MDLKFKNFPLRELNKNKAIKLIANGLQIFTSISILWVFLNIYQTSLLIDNPFIAQDLFYEVIKTRLTGGIILCFGLLVMMILKSLKQNLIISIIGILTIIFYFLKINEIL